MFNVINNKVVSYARVGKIEQIEPPIPGIPDFKNVYKGRKHSFNSSAIFYKTMKHNLPKSKGNR